MKSKTQ